MIHNAIAQLLTTVGGLQAHPSTTSLAAGVFPRLLYTPVGGERTYTDDGVTGLHKGRYVIDVFGTTITQCQTIVDKLTKRASASPNPGLDDYAGTVDSTVIVRIYFPELPSITSGNVTREGANQTVCRMSLDLIVDYRS